MNATPSLATSRLRCSARVWLLALTLAGMAGCSQDLDAQARTLQETLHQQVKQWLEQGHLARQNGYIYTVDVGQLMAYAALRGDAELYGSLRQWAVEHVISDTGDDPYTRGFVVWRHKDGETPDASGTTEALRLAQGLWLGFKAFGNAADQELALLILRGYARHQGTDQGVWFIRNYFNFRTRGFATNSFLVDYDPDFVREAAQSSGEPELVALAEKSYALVRQAVSPCGLIYDLVQPEVLTLTPDLPQVAFSPNDVVQLSNAATVAERVARGEPELARRVLRFALVRQARLRIYYLGRSGQALEGHERFPGVEAYAGLVRLALAVKDRTAATTFLRPLLSYGRRYAQSPAEPRLYTTSEMLLALEMWRQEQAQP